jgi:hypothetical protein
MTDAAAGVHRRARSAVALPLAARAQQDDRVRRIGVLSGRDENDPVYKRDVIKSHTNFRWWPKSGNPT